MFSIVFDIDGIVCDFDKDVWRPTMKDILKKEPIVIDPTSYGMERRYGITYEEGNQVWSATALMAWYMRFAPSIEPAVEHIKSMGSMKDIAFMTARGTHGNPAESEGVRQATRDWVKKHFGGDAVTLFVPADDKISFCVRNGIESIYEDKSSTVLEALNYGMSVCSVKWWYNSDIHTNENVTFYDWVELG